jgi:ABC-type nitrate/sulfonate/bicarbonate transport system ATPase subunit
MENLLLTAKLYHVPDDLAMRKTNEILDLEGLRDASRRMVRTYSGGMKKRLESFKTQKSSRFSLSQKLLGSFSSSSKSQENQMLLG